ncbi:hypothetical protein AFB00_03945 [Pseudonocardia sp. HH130630-07]|nr:hypothetical protein AFB00_03945 [Pseudonocardia sp. HH130630-07]
MDGGRERADRRRNRERLVAAAMELVARDGANASMEEIARCAGVGSATLHRHFGSRFALLEAVFADGVERLCARAGALAVAAGPGEALWTWVDELVGYTAAARGFAETLRAHGRDPGGHSCHGSLRAAVDPLVEAAHTAGTLHPEAGTDDLIDLVTSLSVVTEGDVEASRRLLRLSAQGLHPTAAAG